MNLLPRIILSASLVVAVLNANANTTGFITPLFRGQPGTEFGLWDNPDNFTVALSASLSAPGNVANPGGTSDAVIRQLAGAPGDVFITGGGLVDVSNNVGKTDASLVPFEVHPFAIGTATKFFPGDLVPSGTQLSFELNLADPLVQQYVQDGLNAGRLRFMLTSLHTSQFGGQPAWPDFFTRDSILGAPPTLEIEGALIDSTYTDGDGLPDDWERFCFNSPVYHGDEDPDGDGASNAEEFAAGTDPDDAASVLRVVSSTLDAKAVFTLRFHYAASHRPVIEFSADAQNWSAVANPVLRFYSAPSLVEWRDGSASSSARFYRIRVP